jgi:hypothetical protein
MVAEKINKAGGINGKKLELIVYDTEGDATKANLAVKKLMTQDKVCAVIGPSLSGTSMAVVPLAAQYKTPLISVAASYKITWDDKANKPRQWVFKTPQTDTMAVEAIYTHLKKRGINKIAIMSVTSGFGKSGHGELVRLAPQYGIKIVADESYGPKDTDMTAQLTKIKGVPGPSRCVARPCSRITGWSVAGAARECSKPCANCCPTRRFTHSYTTPPASIPNAPAKKRVPHPSKGGGPIRDRSEPLSCSVSPARNATIPNCCRSCRWRRDG